MSESHTPSVRLEGVSKWYGEVLGLNEVSATFGPGVTGLLGPNGAGKSTLMKLACGMLRPSLGRVTVCDVTPFGHHRIMRRVGHCPEQDAAYSGAPVEEVITYLTRLHGYGHHEARERARRTLGRVGLGHVLRRSAAGFSKGMRQRAKIAQAIAHDPDVLILDEPLNGLDPPGRREVGALFSELGAEGCCVLVSSHILHEVESVAERVMFLFAGRVLADGTVAEIRRELPEHPLTVRIVSPDARRIAARVFEIEGVERVEQTDAGLEILTRRAEALFDAITEMADQSDLTIHAVEPIDEDLEAVFRYLTR